MTPGHPHHAPISPGPLPGQQAGTVVRAARLTAGLTLAQLGQRCGYSASQVSRYERGIQPLTDITVLRRFAATLGITLEALGLAPLPAPPPGGRHAACPKQHASSWHAPRVSGEPDAEDGDDPVRRRELLRAAGAAGVAALGWQPAAHAAGSPPPGPLAGNPAPGETAAMPVPLAELRAATAAARADFQTARYGRLAARLPSLIGSATATRDNTAGYLRAAASTQLAEACITAANLMIKLNDDPPAWALADRALQAAAAGDDPLTLADARRAAATVLRRTGHPTSARDLLTRAARDIAPTRQPTPSQLSMYGTLLEVAAYTAAVDGHRADAHGYLTEAHAAATRLGRDANHRHTAFGPANVTLYQVSIAQVLGDSGTAIQHAKTLDLAAVPTAERRGRFWIDVARAYHQWGKPAPCYRALLAAERAAPGEVRYRPPVHRITEDLLHTTTGTTLPGLRGFAHRIGIPVS
jgi:transcriptional regulator with XRE-family HTH domain